MVYKRIFKSMIRQKTFFILLSSCVLVPFFYKYSELPTDVGYKLLFRNKMLEVRQTWVPYYGSEDFLINTTGCYIPNYIKRFKMKEPRYRRLTCGKRAVSLIKTQHGSIIFTIDKEIMRSVYKAKEFECCYSIVSRSTKGGYQDKSINYSKCKPFQDGTQISHDSEYYTVKCMTGKKEENVYSDAYLLLKRKMVKEHVNNDQMWNLLIIGIDTMSRARLLSSMPKTAEYLEYNGWLDYRGFQKIGYNTFPNLGAMVTGERANTISNECYLSFDNCKHLMIWNDFHEAGYVTAYGEDDLDLPDTFSRNEGFKTVPTDHYTRPFFLTGESTSGNYICTGHRPSSEHLLNYAYDYVDAYKNNSFFGAFWINTISHNLLYSPILHDKSMVEFFENLEDTGILNNTFIFFLSDHGIRFGDSRNSIEGYYEERLPMLYLWTPLNFRSQYNDLYYNLQINQNRLVTPYDMYLTFRDVVMMSQGHNACSNTAWCPLCSSIFHAIPETRTCSDVDVNDKWCTCHSAVPINKNSNDVYISLQIALSKIQNKSQTVETKPCTKCLPLSLDKVYRTHTYSAGNKTYYVVAFNTKPGKMKFEATIVKENNTFNSVDNIYTLSSYGSTGECAINPYHRAYCVCEKDKKLCKKHEGTKRNNKTVL